MARLFVAVWPSADVLDALERLPRPPLAGARWTTRRQWHVTVRYFGVVDIDWWDHTLTLALRDEGGNTRRSAILTFDELQLKRG